MAIDAFGVIASLFVAGAEISWRNEKRCKYLGLAALVCVLAASSAWYALSAFFHTLFGGLALWSRSSERCSPLATRVFVGITHMNGVWGLPFLAMWGIYDMTSSDRFVAQEIGHVAPSTFLTFGLVVSPLLLAPRKASYQPYTLDFQSFEGKTFAGLGLLLFTVYRISHSLRRNMGPLPASDWEHELLDLVWFGCGVLGLLAAKQKVYSHIGGALPLLYMYYTLSGHSHAAGEPDAVTVLWMHLHQIAALLYGTAGLCRLLDRTMESMCFAFLGAFVFVNSSRDSAIVWWDAFGVEDDVHATVRVTALNLVVFGILFFATHVGLLQRLRNTMDDDDDDDDANGGGGVEGRNGFRDANGGFRQIHDLELDEDDGSENGDVQRAVALSDDEDDDEQGISSAAPLHVI